MKNRCVFRTNDLPTARAAMQAAHQAGIDDDDIGLLARKDIQKLSRPGQRLHNRNDFYPALWRGALWGGIGGLVLGLIAGLLIPASGFPLEGAIATCVIGAIAGGCMSAVAGAGIADPVDRRFKSEIDSGHILVVVDVPEDQLTRVEASVTHVGAVRLPFETPTVAT
ncbi:MULTISPECIES: DUF1269 domain-containing protein [Rhodanobacter]|jgi:hypothetical protein|nr:MULTISPECIES: DUF1269 domain-containing protein [Rhodanobacter]EIL94596.1 hypothetical protein UU5_11500 [Rhodanobacter sp. 115]SFK19640.1 Protein of unknown function [Rhodanobacter glycinis]